MRRACLLAVLPPLALIAGNSALRAAPLVGIRRMMAETLPPRTEPPPVAELLEMYEGPDTRQEAINWLFLADDPEATDLLRPLLDSPDRILRAIACRYVGRVEGEQAAPRLEGLARDRAWLVRLYAAEGLARAGGAEAERLLERLAQDEHREVADFAKRMLRRLEDPRPAEPGLGLEVSSPQPAGQPVKIEYAHRLPGDFARGIISSADKGAIGGYSQLLVFRAGREISRIDIPRYRYRYRPPLETSQAGIQYAKDRSNAINEIDLGLPPGTYELQVEARYLCTEMVALDFVERRFGHGARKTVAAICALASERVPLEIVPAQPPPQREVSPEVLGRLARLLAEPGDGVQPISVAVSVDGEAQTIEVDAAQAGDWIGDDETGLKAVLKCFSPDQATPYQIYVLGGSDDPRAAAAVEQAFMASNDIAGWYIGSLRKPFEEETIDRLLDQATREVGSEGWGWHESRQALEALDGKLGPDQREHVPALIRELTGRLNERRDRYSMRGGESISGAFRTAFFLGRIGDARAAPVLRRAAGHDNLLLRWHAVAALKLIDVQNAAANERTRLVREWLRHCFSSPEEHFMSRGRLIPYLSDMLGEARARFYDELMRELTDPWMRHDAARFSAA